MRFGHPVPKAPEGRPFVAMGGAQRNPWNDQTPHAFDPGRGYASVRMSIDRSTAGSNASLRVAERRHTTSSHSCPAFQAVDSGDMRKKARMACLGTGLCIALGCAPASGQVLRAEFELFGGQGDRYGAFEQTFATDGEVIALGSPDEDVGFAIHGAVDLYNAHSGEHLRRITLSEISSQLGLSVAVSDGLLATTVKYFKNGGPKGAVLLYKICSGELIRSIPIDFKPSFDTWPIAMKEGLLVVGSKYPQPGEPTASADVFDITTGERLRTLLPPGDARGTRFASSVAIDDGVVVIGSPFEPFDVDLLGEAYAFDLATGDLLRRFPQPTRGYESYFGMSVAITAGVVAVGDAADPAFGFASGAAYLFDLESGELIRKVLPDDAHEEDTFGWYLGAGDGVVAVGSIWDDDLGDMSGSAYVFDARSGEQLAKLVPEDGRAGDWFGHGLAVAGGRVLVGAKLDTNNGEHIGSVHQFLLPAACPVDLADPVGVLNFLDIAAFLTMWSRSKPAADFAPPYGTLNLDDVTDFLDAYSVGCP